MGFKEKRRAERALRLSGKLSQLARSFQSYLLSSLCFDPVLIGNIQFLYGDCFVR